MLRLLLPVRLLVALAVMSGGAMAIKQPSVRAILPPKVADAVDLIQDKQGELAAAFQ